ncbi:leucine-rich repeat domain-containing protein [Proteinivorax tanatarense]|uniref:Leucine-rich repeat domain-containing protein n=1 Tax=Proteinivorax tanatarense TaxID=1260629 RepID=A0AAU7VP72_9FIRM
MRDFQNVLIENNTTRTILIFLLLVATFGLVYLTSKFYVVDVSVAVEPEGTGEVHGTGIYEKGETVNLKVIPKDGYGLYKWTEENQIELKEEFVDVKLKDYERPTMYSLTSNKNRDLTAHFSPLVDLEDKGLSNDLKRSFNNQRNINGWYCTENLTLAHLEHLEHIQLSRHIRIEDEDFFTKVPNAKSLTLEGTNLDLSILKRYPNIKSLTIIGCPYSEDDLISIDKLEQLTELRILNVTVDEQQLKDISKLGNLEVLEITKSELTDISPISELTNLKELNLNQNSISNLAPLSNLTTIKKLQMDNNYIEDISALNTMSNLEYISLSKNQIVDITALKKLEKVKKINLENNEIESVQPLKTLTNLEDLNVGENKVQNVTTLGKLESLKKLNLTSNKISEITALKNLQVDKLYLSDNYISHIKSLEGIDDLKFLDVSNNSITDSSQIKNLSNVEKINIRGNEIDGVLSQINQIEICHIIMEKENIEEVIPLDLEPWNNLTGIELLKSPDGKDTVVLVESRELIYDIVIINTDIFKSGKKRYHMSLDEHSKSRMAKNEYSVRAQWHRNGVDLHFERNTLGVENSLVYRFDLRQKNVDVFYNYE